MIVCSGRLRGASVLGWPFSQREQAAAILQHEARPRRHQPRAEAAVVALDERHDVAVLVDDGHVDGVVALGVGDPGQPIGQHLARRFVGHDQLGTIDGACLVEHRRGRDHREARVADVPQHVGVGQLLGLDHHVQGVRAVEAVLAEREALHQVQHHQRGDALGVRADLVDVPAAVVGLHRRDPLGLVLGQVGGGERAALLLGDRQDGLGGRPGVVAVAPALGDAAQRAGQVGVPEHLAGPRRPLAVDEVGLLRVRVLAVHLRRARPAAGGHFRQGEAVLGVVDGGASNSANGLVPNFAAHGVPSGHHARHGHRVDAALRHRGDALRRQELRREPRRRPAAGVQSVDDRRSSPRSRG